MFHATFVEENSEFQARLVHEQVDEITAEGTRQKGIVVAAGTEQVLAVNNVGAVQVHSVENAGAEQVDAVTAEGNTQKSAITTYCEGQQTAIDLKVSAANNAKDDAVTAKEQAETAQRNSETAANTATQKASEAAEHDILTQTGLTDEQKNTARTNINAAKLDGVYELIETITLTEETTTIVRTTMPSGEPLNLSRVWIKIMCPQVASTSTAYYSIKNQSNSVVSDGDWGTIMSTSYAAYSEGEIWNDAGRWATRFVAPGGGPAWRGTVSSKTHSTFGDVSDTISRLQITGNLPAGSVFTVYGVRA